MKECRVELGQAIIMHGRDHEGIGMPTLETLSPRAQELQTPHRNSKAALSSHLGMPPPRTHTP